MKNIEKYKDEIKVEIEKDKTLGCVVNKLMGNTCDDYPKCNDCYLKVLDWLLQEYKEPILTDKEKACLKKIIKSKRDSVIYISKIAFLKGTENESTNIVIATKCTLEAISTVLLAPFDGMELERKYSLEELGL